MEFFYTKPFSVTDAQKNSGVIHGKMKLNSTRIYQMFLLRAKSNTVMSDIVGGRHSMTSKNPTQCFISILLRISFPF